MINLKTICIIPARKGSKSIKNKNLSLVKKIPLVTYSFKICEKFKNKFISFVSTDSIKILNLSKKFKIKNNALRPKKLSGDKVLTYDVIKYEVLKTEKRLKIMFENILILQPTCPFRSEKLLNKALKSIKNKKYDSIVTITDVGANHPERMKIIKNNKLINYTKKRGENLKPKQTLPKVYIRSGSIYLIKREAFFKFKSLVGKKCLGIVVSGKEAINIDNKEDLIIANHF